MSAYYTAEVCVNGHTSTNALELLPHSTEKFCSKCGGKTIQQCPACNTRLRGYLKESLSAADYTPPRYCYECGAALPWTVKHLETAKELATELEALSRDERQQLQAAIDGLLSDGPRMELAVSRFKRLMRKAGQAAGSSLYRIAIDLASEAAKKALLGK